MSEPTWTPPPPPVSAAPASNRAMISMILGILGIVCCGILAPIAWYMGGQELKAIQAGMADRKNEGLAKAGQILGIIGTILLALGLVWVVFFGGMAILSGMSQMGG